MRTRSRQLELAIMLLVLLVAIALASVVFWAFRQSWVYRTQVVEGSAATYKGFAEDLRIGKHLNILPTEAVDIKYFAIPGSSYMCVSFRISEKAFREWAIERGWKATEIPTAKGTSIAMETAAGGIKLVRVADGLCCCEKRFKEGSPGLLTLDVEVVYCRAKKRAYCRIAYGD